MLGFYAFVFSLVILFTSSYSMTIQDVKEKNNNANTNANTVVENLLDDLRPVLREKFDPATLPDAGFDFEKKILFVTARGEVKFYEGWLAGLSTLYRSGGSSVDRKNEGNLVRVTSKLGLGQAVAHYKANVKFMDLGPTFEATVTVPEVVIDIAVQQTLNQGDSRPILTHFDIVSTGKLEVKLGGLGYLNWINSKIVSFMSNIVIQNVMDSLESPIRLLIVDELRKGAITLEGI